MTMIRINLMPHRQLKRERQARQFAAMAGIALFVGAAAVAAGHLAIATATDNQTRRNDFLRQETAKLDEQLAEIKRLKEKTEALVARKNVVETLQSDRAVPVHLLDELARRMPDGVQLKSIKQTERTLAIQGFAPSNALVSEFMRVLDESTWLESSVLVEVKAATVNNVRSNEFSLTATIKNPNAKDDTKEAKPRKGAA